MRHERSFVMILCVGSLLLSLSYALFIPPGERRDEAYHYQIIEFISKYGQIPSRTAKMAEAFQPPLYYVLSAPLKLAVVGSEVRYDTLRSNMFIYREHRLGTDPADNVNFYLHPKSHWLPTSDPLTIGFITMRLFSVILGALNLAAAYGLIKRVWPQASHLRLTAIAIVSGWQSLQYSFGSVTNDNAVILLSTVSLLLMAKQSQDGPGWTSSILLGLALGGALLAKASGLILIVPYLTFVVTGWARAKRYSAVTTFIMLATAGWWYVWSAVVYQDPLGLNAQYQLYPMLRTRPDELVERISAAHLARVYSTLWLYFDYEGILMPRPFYWIFDLLAVAGTSGLIVWLVQGKSAMNAAMRPLPMMIGLYVAAMGFAALYHAITNNAGNSGRHLLQAGVPIAICLARGLDTWISRRAVQYVWIGLSVALMAVGAICLYVYYIPAFQPPPIPPHIDHSLTIRYGDTAELFGVKEARIRATAGQEFIVTLYWRALAKGSNDLTLLLDSSPPGIEARRSFPGAGTFLAGDWEPGDTWTDVYILKLSDEANYGTYRVLVRLIHADTGQLLQSLSQDGHLILPTVMSVIVERP